MSGPIVRKYGFPNFDKIFGERPLQHGADEPEGTEDESGNATKKKAGTTTDKKPSGAKGKKKEP
jgi:hypothetical protein